MKMIVEQHEEEFLTVVEAAELKGVGETAIYRAVEEGRVPSCRMLGRILIRLKDLEDYHPGSYGGVQRHVVQRGRGRKKPAELQK